MGGNYEQQVEAELPDHAKKPTKTEIGPDAVVEDIPEGAVDVHPTPPSLEQSHRPLLGPIIQGFRIHENQGEIHWHEKGGDNLKVAMPVAEFWNFWNKISNLQIDSYSYLDPERGTLLTVATGLDDGRNIDLRVKITKEANGIGIVYSQLETFVEGLRDG